MFPKIVLAKETLKKINGALEKDDGNSFRYHLKQILPHIGDIYRQDDSPFRSHLGASLIGSDCEFALWLGFRWASKEKFEGRVLRLFNRGHMEEARFIALLLMVGCQVYQQDSDGNQFRISEFGGHFGGSGDGVVFNLPDAHPNEPILLEAKTHSEKSFKGLLEEGVRFSKPVHYAQMVVYMEKMQINRALYMAVNKNDDSLHMEIIEANAALANHLILRAEGIVFANKKPKKVGKTPGFWKCKFCNFSNICHLGGEPLENCRTCIYSEVKEDGSWFCGYNEKPLNKQEQLKGCSNWFKHEFINND